jgi:putative acetyltransferase
MGIVAQMGAALSFRDAKPADRAHVLAIVSAAFGFPPESERWHHIEQMLTLPGHYWRLAELQGLPVAALCVAVSRLRVGEGYLVKADVGEVAVRPEYQGKGIGTALMKDTIRWMRGQGFDFSRLGGLVRFYSRFGYEPFVRRYVEFYLRPSIGAGASTARPSYLLQSREPQVFPLDPKEWTRCQEMSKKSISWRVGALLEARAEQPFGQCLVYREGGAPLAWAQLVEHPLDRTEFESRLTIAAAAWEPGREDAMAALVAHVLRLAHDRGHERVCARLPFDPALFAALTAAGLPYKAVELHEATAATMVQVLNLASCFEHLLPELERRWHLTGLPVRMNIGLEVAGQQVLLQLAPGAVGLAEDGAADVGLSLTQSELLALALGLHSSSYVLHQRLQRCPQVAAALAVLFPEQLSVSGVWG